MKRIWHDVPSVVLLFLMMVFPLSQDLLYAKGALFGVCALIAAADWQSGRGLVCRAMVFWVCVCAAAGCAFVAMGYYAGADKSFRAFQVYVLWPLVYLLLTASWADRRTLRRFETTAVISLTVIGVFALTYWLVQLGVLPRWAFTPLVDQGEAIGTYTGYTRLNLYSLNSLPFLLPFAIAAVLNYDAATRSLPRVSYVVAACLGVVTVFLANRRGALVAAAVAVPLALGLGRTIRRRPVRVRRRLWVGMLVAGLCTLSVAGLERIYAFSVAGVLDYLKAGFNFVDASDYSTALRKEEFLLLVDKIAEAPLFGHGLGVPVPGLIRSDEDPGQYELVYVALIYDTGFVGFLLYAGGVTWALFAVWKGLRRSRGHALMGIPLLVGAVSMLIVNATNPILARFDGLWVLFWPLAFAGFVQSGHEREGGARPPGTAVLIQDTASAGYQCQNP